MHILSRQKLRASWRVHPDARVPLERWYDTARRARWKSFEDIRAAFGRGVDRVGKFLVFDTGGNNYRLIVVAHFNRGKLFVRRVLTHAEYDKGDWKEE